MSLKALLLIDELLSALNDPPKAIIKAIYIYPIYGFGPIALKANEDWEYRSDGFKYDRNWGVINCKTKKIVSQISDITSYSKLHLLKPSIVDKKYLMIQFPTKQYKICIEEISNKNEINKTNKDINNLNIALSEYLGFESKLCVLNKNDTKKKSKTRWFPFLVMFEESIMALNKYINGDKYYDHHRFEPNILIKGWSAFYEDNIKYIQFMNNTGYIFKCNANELNEFCCNCTRIDPLTGKINQNDNGEPSKTIKKFRNSQFGLMLNLVNDTDIIHGTLSLNQTVISC